MEVSSANSSLNGVRGTRVSRKVIDSRSYVEVTGQNKNQGVDCFLRPKLLEAHSNGSDVGALISLNTYVPARSMVGPKVESKKLRKFQRWGKRTSRRLGRARTSVLRRAGALFR